MKRKKPDDEENEAEEEDPFDDKIYHKLFPALGTTYDISFGKEKKNLLKPGEKGFDGCRH